MAAPPAKLHRRPRSFAGWSSAALAMLATLGTAGTAYAGGFDLPDNGARAVGRGGSYVVGVSDPTAIYYNPGALSKQRGTQFL